MKRVDTLVMQLRLLLPQLPLGLPDIKNMQVAIVVACDDHVPICSAVHGGELGLLTAVQQLEVASGGVQTTEGAVVAA